MGKKNEKKTHIEYQNIPRPVCSSFSSRFLSSLTPQLEGRRAEKPFETYEQRLTIRIFLLCYICFILLRSPVLVLLLFHILCRLQ